MTLSRIIEATTHLSQSSTLRRVAVAIFGVARVFNTRDGWRDEATKGLQGLLELDEKTADTLVDKVVDFVDSVKKTEK
jgi:hypothetical protein